MSDETGLLLPLRNIIEKKTKGHLQDGQAPEVSFKDTPASHIKKQGKKTPSNQPPSIEHSPQVPTSLREKRRTNEKKKSSKKGKGGGAHG